MFVPPVFDMSQCLLWKRSIHQLPHSSATNPCEEHHQPGESYTCHVDSETSDGPRLLVGGAMTPPAGLNQCRANTSPAPIPMYCCQSGQLEQLLSGHANRSQLSLFKMCRLIFTPMLQRTRRHATTAMLHLDITPFLHQQLLEVFNHLSNNWK